MEEKIKRLLRYSEEYPTNLEIQYALAIARTIEANNVLPDRTGTSIYYGGPVTFKLQGKYIKDFPKLLGKAVYPKLAYKEMLWFMMGKNDKKSLNEMGVNYWDPWFKEDGTIGKSYGYQFRHGKADQLSTLIEELRNNPYSRRLMINLWNKEELSDMALPPCFYNYQFSLSHIIERTNPNTYCYDLVVTSRSADAFLGVPYNFMSSYVLGEIACILASSKNRNYEINSITWNIGNFHVYTNHVDQCKLYIKNLLETLDKLGNLREWDIQDNFIKLNHTEDTIDDFLLTYLVCVKHSNNTRYKSLSVLKNGHTGEEMVIAPPVIKADISV